MRLGRCGEEPGGGQRERLEAWVGKKFRGPSRFGAAGGSPEQVRAAGGSEAGEPQGARGAAGADKEAGARSSPHRPSTSPSSPLRKKEGNLRGKRDCPLLLLLRTAGREGLLLSLSLSLRRLSPSLQIRVPRGPEPPPPTRPTCIPHLPFSVRTGLRRRASRRRAPCAARGAASEPEWAGAGRARAARRGGAGERPGHVWRRRGRFRAPGFKKVWSGPGAFPGLAEGRRAQAAAAAAGRRTAAPADALSASAARPRAPAAQRNFGSCRLPRNFSAGLRARALSAPSAAFSPSLHAAPSSRRLQN